MRTYSKRMLRLQRYFRARARRTSVSCPCRCSGSSAEQNRSVIRVLLSETGRDITFPPVGDDFVQPARHHRSVRRTDCASRSCRTADQRRPVGAPIARLYASSSKQRTALLDRICHARRTLINQLVGSRNVRAAIAAEVAKGKTSEARVTNRARRHARAMVSDMSYITIRLLQRVLTWFWNRIYDGIDAHGVERIKLLAETSTLVYVPCHRSHVDYLVLSYLLYSQGLMIPHVAAGDNLNMPLIGPLLRRGGAFFMRRSFGDDRLYSAVFSEYVYQLFRRGSPSEYFIEGGRSRTGLAAPARQL